MKKTVIGACAVGLGVAAVAARRNSGIRAKSLVAKEQPRHLSPAEEGSNHSLLYFVIPLWLAAGFADYLFHRRSHIERTSGTRESLSHLVMLSEGAVAVVPGLFFEVNALLLVVAVVALIAHTVTAWIDVAFAYP